MAKQKFYVVWDGDSQGVFSSWEACQEAVVGVPGARYKAFSTSDEAEDAFNMGYEAWKAEDDAKKAEPVKAKTVTDVNGGNTPTPNTHHPTPNTHHPTPITHLPTDAIRQAIAVDAACSGNPGKMEYRGVYLDNGREIFHFGPVYGTNNIGEFLAIVHGLALLKQKGLDTMPLYSDSVNAQLWVRKKKCKTTLVRNEKTEQLHQMIERAEKWLQNNTYVNPIIKWPTEKWGEIPADFGRK